jgi:hypothetical protein
MKISLIALGLIVPAGFALAQNPQRPSEPSSGRTAQSQSTESTSKTTGDKADKTANTGELKTQTYKGTLVDASCAAGGGAATTSSTSSTSRSTEDRSASSNKTDANKTGEANRAGDSGKSCNATTSTTAFGLQMRDGHVMRFDSVGNERAKEALAAKKKWQDDASAGKPIHVSVSGTESADTLTVVSIH